MNQDQITTAVVPDRDHLLGSIVVLHPGHPLCGQTLPVVRRIGRHDARQWVIEQADGSRQYVPVTWCTPLAMAQGDLSVPAPDSERHPSLTTRTTPLTLAALRELAALVHQLQEAGAQRGEHEHDHAAGDGTRQHASTIRPERERAAPARSAASRVGELYDRRSTTPGANDPPRRAASPVDRAGCPDRGVGEVSP